MKLADYAVTRGKDFRLAGFDPADTRAVNGDKAAARERLTALQQRLNDLQDVFYADRRHRLLLVLQGMDTAGKDSTIRHVFQNVDPLGVRVSSFGPPSASEGARDFLWRVHRKVPGNGEIVIFNRSHYEDVLVPVVNGTLAADALERRYCHIADFERMLTETGTTLVKCFLNISKDEQKKRLEERRDTPEKRWKLAPSDLEARAQWDAYQRAYEAAIAATASKHAPWHIVPADSKLARNLLISQLLVETLEGLGLEFPQPVAGVEKLVIE